MDEVTVVNVGRDFSRFPVGRYAADGDANGEAFRRKYLEPAIRSGRVVRIELDDALGYGSSFLEEAFAGLIRHGFDEGVIGRHLKLVTADDSLREEIEGYIRDAVRSK